jgi:hypothetical protein
MPDPWARQISLDRWSSWSVRAAAMARVNWSVNIESAFRGVTRRRAIDSGKARTRRKKALASIQFFRERSSLLVQRTFPALPDTGPPFIGMRARGSTAVPIKAFP